MSNKNLIATFLLLLLKTFQQLMYNHLTIYLKRIHHCFRLQRQEATEFY